jgi:hypothetical protein
VIFVVAFAGGLAIGLLTGRWWIVLAPALFGGWIAVTTGVDEVPPWFLGLAYTLAGATGVLVGVFIRRRPTSGHQWIRHVRHPQVPGGRRPAWASVFSLE